jgi:hypothetical protein
VPAAQRQNTSAVRKCIAWFCLEKKKSSSHDTSLRNQAPSVSSAKEASNRRHFAPRRSECILLKHGASFPSPVGAEGERCSERSYQYVVVVVHVASPACRSACGRPKPSENRSSFRV